MAWMFIHILQKYQNYKMTYRIYWILVCSIRPLKNEEKWQNMIIYISDFLPEPKSLSEVWRLITYIWKKIWEIPLEKNGLFHNGNFLASEMTLPIDEVISVKLALKTKLNVHERLDKGNTRVCLRGDIQIKDKSNQ